MYRCDKEEDKSEEEILAEIKQRVEERIKAYSSIQRLHEDIEKCKLIITICSLLIDTCLFIEKEGKIDFSFSYYVVCSVGMTVQSGPKSLSNI